MSGRTFARQSLSLPALAVPNPVRQGGRGLAVRAYPEEVVRVPIVPSAAGFVRVPIGLTAAGSAPVPIGLTEVFQILYARAVGDSRDPPLLGAAPVRGHRLADDRDDPLLVRSFCRFGDDPGHRDQVDLRMADENRLRSSG